jgi:hypothetical protein
MIRPIEYKLIVSMDPKLKRNKVWCHKCGHEQDVDSAECLRFGWPKCCDQTMSIDWPEERK